MKNSVLLTCLILVSSLAFARQITAGYFHSMPPTSAVNPQLIDLASGLQLVVARDVEIDEKSNTSKFFYAFYQNSGWYSKKSLSDWSQYKTSEDGHCFIQDPQPNVKRTLRAGTKLTLSGNTLITVQHGTANRLALITDNNNFLYIVCYLEHEELADDRILKKEHSPVNLAVMLEAFRNTLLPFRSGGL